MVAASLSKFYGGVVGAEMSQPLPTVTSIDHNAVQMAHMVKLKGTNLGGPVSEPVQTITAGGWAFRRGFYGGGPCIPWGRPEELAQNPGAAEYILRI